MLWKVPEVPEPVNAAPRLVLAPQQERVLLKELVDAHPHPLRGGKQPRILFGTQAASRPPTFVLFTTGFLEAGYRRFVERRLREEFGFVGTPVRINLRIREKRGAKR